MNNPFNSLQNLGSGPEAPGKFYSLPQLEKEGAGNVSRLPASIRIVLESVLRNCDGKRVCEGDVEALAGWAPRAERTAEVPFVVARVLLQDFTGVPLLVDLAAMRSAVSRRGQNPEIIEPLVPVDLVIDHSVQIDFVGHDALRKNMEMEFRRNRERYQLLKWGTQAFQNFKVVPPEIGICHQVNLEYLSKVVMQKDGVFFPDTLVGTDSHTTMVNGLSVLGWGVGGIEAEAAMLGLPVYNRMPDVIGFYLSGHLREGVTATDLVLTITEILRRTNVVGKFVEFHGEGAAGLSVPDRSTIANMAPEYGATAGFFPPDEQTCAYLEATGRPAEQVDLVRRYFSEQGMFGMPGKGDCDYTSVIELDLADVKPSVAGPRRPQDRINLPGLKRRFEDLLKAPVEEGGYGKASGELAARYPIKDGSDSPYVIHGGGDQDNAEAPIGTQFTSTRNTNTITELEMMNNRPTPDDVAGSTREVYRDGARDLGHGDVVIASITSCTNTSNPSVMLAAGILARKAVERGLAISPAVKPSLAPGSRVVTEYYKKTGLLPYLEALGFHVVAYGCTTCIGNSGPLDPRIEDAMVTNDVIGASVLSGNRNFEARVHGSVKANFLMSPPLVVAFALAGRVNIDLAAEPLGRNQQGEEVFLKDIWPTPEELSEALAQAFDPEKYKELYGDFADENPLWNEIESSKGKLYDWDEGSTYIKEPPYFENFGMAPGEVNNIRGARALAIFPYAVTTTDHISPAGAIKADSPAGIYLRGRSVQPVDFNSYGARRGNHEVMVRGTFANVRLRNLLARGVEGGVTVHQPSGDLISIYDASVRYREASTPLLIFGAGDYGMGSSRDWAAKGTRLLGVRAVIAQSFERIHRSNLVGMGVLPCQFKGDTSAQTLGLDGTETFDLIGFEKGITPRQDLTMIINRTDGTVEEVPLMLRIDTPIEVDYYRHGGILPYMLRQLLSEHHSDAAA